MMPVLLCDRYIYHKKQIQTENMDKQTIHFDMSLFQGYTCIGCAVINDLAFEVEFTDDEIAQMKQLVSQISKTRIIVRASCQC